MLLKTKARNSIISLDKQELYSKIFAVKNIKYQMMKVYIYIK